MIVGKVLITDAVHDVMLQEFHQHGYEINYKPDCTNDEVKSIISVYQGLIINSKIRCDKEFIDKGINLKFIARLGSGREVVDIPYAQSKGIKVYFSPEGNKNAVAEHAMGMLLSLANQLNQADIEVKQKIWNREDRRGWELKGKTIGIIGFGHTGSQFAKKLQGFEMRVLAYDKYLAKNYSNKVNFVKEVVLDELIHQSSIISFHLPLAKDTFHIADKSFFDKCNPATIVINTSRGSVIDTKALVNALDSGHLGGACLDVFENEKPSTYSIIENELYNRLFQMKNVILSPHIAGWTIESKYLLSKVLLDKIFSI